MRALTAAVGRGTREYNWGRIGGTRVQTVQRGKGLEEELEWGDVNWTNEGEEKEQFSEGPNGGTENQELSRMGESTTDDWHELICMGAQGSLGKCFAHLNNFALPGHS